MFLLFEKNKKDLELVSKSIKRVNIYVLKTMFHKNWFLVSIIKKIKNKKLLTFTFYLHFIQHHRLLTRFIYSLIFCWELKLLQFISKHSVKHKSSFCFSSFIKMMWPLNFWKSFISTITTFPSFRRLLCDNPKATHTRASSLF